MRTTSIITDSVGWTLVSGSFIADAPYSFLYLGNFFSDPNTQYVVVDPSAPDQYSYYYYDDVCLSPLPGSCPIAISVAEQTRNDMVKAWIMQNSNSIQVGPLIPSTTYQYELFDLRGSLLSSGVLSTSGVIPLLGSNELVVLRVWDGSEVLHFKLPVLSTKP